jgi:hypothetical protein
MQLHNIEGLLADRKSGEELWGVGIGMVQEEGAIGGYGEDAGAGASALAKDGRL